MTDFRQSDRAVAIESVDQLVEQLHVAGKPPARWAIGTEYEKVVVDRATGRAAPFSGRRGIETVLRTLGLRMMKQPATVQANIDYADERDAMLKLRVGMGLAPILNAMFANSSLSDRGLNGYMSCRGHIWTRTDPARCGLLRLAFREGATFADYVDWALDVPLYFILRDGTYLTTVTGTPFRRFLAEGAAGERATLDDWNLHLTTLFPEVRLKGYIEFRSADSQPPDRMLALPALVEGVFYEADFLGAANDLVKRWSYDETDALWRQVHREAPLARFRRVRVLELARELYAIAEEGLRRQHELDPAGRDERIYLERMGEQLAMGRSPARVIAEKWNGEWDRRVERLIAFAEYRG